MSKCVFPTTGSYSPPHLFSSLWPSFPFPFPLLYRTQNDDFTRFHSKESGTVLDDASAFGDISRIAIDNDTSRIHLSPTNDGAAVMDMDAIDYTALHRKDIRVAARQLLQDARLSGRSTTPATRTNSLAVLLSTDSQVLKLPMEQVPSPLRKKSTIGENPIIVGGNKGRILQELGRGAFGTVVLLEGPPDEPPVAVKVQAPLECLAWEFTVLKRLQSRLCGSTASTTKETGAFPFPRSISYVALADGGLMGMSPASFSGLNLVDIVNVYRAQENGPVPELIALHYTIRMLRHVELLHWHGQILHCDIKPDNWVMAPSSTAFEGCSQEIPASDLVLVDFGRAVDMEAAAGNTTEPMNVRLYGEAVDQDMACVAIRNGWSWSFDIDTYGICASAHVLLYGSHLEIERDTTTKVWRPKKALRRYWQRELWTNLFNSLLNVDEVSRRAMGSRPGNLRSIRTTMEEYVNSRTKELESMLRHQGRMLPEKKK